MKKQLLSAGLAAALFLGAGAAEQAGAMVQQRTRHHYVQRSASSRHKRHMKTAKRVGVGAAGGAAVGALAGGGKGLVSVQSRELEPERCTTGTNRKSTSDSSRESTDRGGKEGQPGRFTFENLDPGIYQIQVVQAL